MEKLIIYGDHKNILAQKILACAKNDPVGILVEIIENYNDLDIQLPKLANSSLILINKGENEAINIKTRHPDMEIILCRGGEKDFQPNLVIIDKDKNHQYLLFENWNDFWAKIKHPPTEKNRSLIATRKDNEYTINYQGDPQLEKRGAAKASANFFWFSVLLSRFYLNWLEGWLEEVNKMQFSLDLRLEGETKIRRLIIPFSNKHRGEAIFREGEGIIFSSAPPLMEREEYYDHYDYNEACAQSLKSTTLTGTVVAADEEGLEILLDFPTAKMTLKQQKSFRKGGNLLDLLVKAYTGLCAGYSDLSLKDYIYSQENFYYRPEDFLRGYLPNHNKLHLPISSLMLDGKSKVVLQDSSQIQALTDILGPNFISLIKGPPGTGKTLLSSVAIKQLVLQGKIVLVTAHSNQGLDNLLEALSEHVSPKKIFRLGNKPQLINSKKARAWHRHEKYRKKIEKDRQAFISSWLEKNKEKADDPESLKKAAKHFFANSQEIYYESEEIWRLICKNEGLVLGITINSFQFDETLRLLLYHDRLLACSQDFSDSWERLDRITKYRLRNPGEDYMLTEMSLPIAVSEYMARDNEDGKKSKPQFIIDAALIDEATKGRFFEFLPIIKKVDSKLILIGDTDQLGNIPIPLEIKEEMLGKIMSGLIPNPDGRGARLYSTLEESHPLQPIETTKEAIIDWFDNFSQGMFYSLINNSHLESNNLNINRRSLPVITDLLNYVFDKRLRIGRFNPHFQGSVVFLDSDGQETRVRTSYKNDREVSLASQEMLNFFQRQKKASGEINLNSLGIIATYRGQVKAIKEKIRQTLLFHPLFTDLVNQQNIDHILNDLVNTVDAFQGSEREAIIVSFVRSNDEGQIGFSSDIRRLYVALSRPRNELIIIGNAQTFLKSKDQKIKNVFGRLIHFTQEKKTYGRKILELV
ncbi:MAG: AAA domain-containing protein [Patescibacteria group bacterium]